jgi:hypothetical protein
MYMYKHMQKYSNIIIVFFILLAFAVTAYRTIFLNDFWVIETEEELLDDSSIDV